MNRADTRHRVLGAAAGLFRRQGYAGTGLSQIAEQSGTHVGSIYHFFPGGKDALVAEALETGGQEYGDLVLSMLNSVSDPATAIRLTFDAAADDLAAANYADACPVATVALEAASTNELVRRTADGVFGRWITGLSEWFTGHGLGDEAHDLALITLSSLEGAFILARTSRDGTALRAAGRQLARLVEQTNAGRVVE